MHLLKEPLTIGEFEIFALIPLFAEVTTGCLLETPANPSIKPLSARHSTGDLEALGVGVGVGLTETLGDGEAFTVGLTETLGVGDAFGVGFTEGLGVGVGEGVGVGVEDFDEYIII